MNQSLSLNLYATPPHECSYLPDRQATTVFIDPYFPKDKTLHGTLLQRGFRRSGDYVYRPICKHCQACIPVRIPVHTFKPRRSQKRVWKKNQDLTVIETSCDFQQIHFDLYRRYLASRHKGGNMENPTPQDYMDFLTSPWSETVFFEFRLQQQLLGIAVVDPTEDALSAVYTFFDPDYSERSLGVYAILWEIELAKQLDLDWLYLGFWIGECRKMAYKIDYQPLEFYDGEEWHLFSREDG